MALRTADDYIDSLRDGRAVYYAGERIADVTAHPLFGMRARQISEEFGRGLAESDDLLDERTVTLDDGDRVRRWLVPPRDKEALLRYVEMESNMHGATHGAIMAGLAGLEIVARKSDAQLGTHYLERIQSYTDWFQRSDLHAVLAMTDAKGDRSKGPHGQADPDLWLRVVERREDGIVIRGAKTSVTDGALTNEFLVLPTHAMSADDADWSVACAVPADAPGVVMIANYVGQPWGDRFRFDRPLTHDEFRHEVTIFFNDVFVPWSRVFLDGEFVFTRDVITYFTTFHRAGAIVREPRETKKLIGAAQLMARYNGLEGVGNIRNGIAEMVETAQMLDILRFTALARTSMIEGVCVPDAVACNLAGLTATRTRPGYLQFLCELVGGPVLTAPSGLDLANPETRALVEKYYVGKAGVSAEERLRLVKYVYDLAASDSAGFARASSVTAAGSPSAKRVALARNFDINACVELVMEDLKGAAVPELAGAG
ncbi:MAG: 4-hydroxyphenylacetate 3-hydroxylase N-terminal domain-containing protein [Dehalococcoidia bacterium]